LQQPRVCLLTGAPPKAALLTAVEVVRRRVLGDLAASRAVPVRILSAPHGAGKTTALRQFVEANADTGIVSLTPAAGSAEVMASLATVAAFGLVVVDRADVAAKAGCDALFEIIDDGLAHGKRYLLSGLSRNLMRAQTAIAHGGAELIEAGVLAFSAAEIAELAAAQGVAGDEMDVEQLKYDTDGWPVAVAWIVRDAARTGSTLRGAFAQWHERSGHLLLEFVTASHDDPEASEAFVTAMRSMSDLAAQRTLELLEARGWPIVRMRTGMRPYRALTWSAGGPSKVEAERVDGRLKLNLFGHFSCRIANHPVTFDRRRDQNLLTYVALAPGATVPRTELLAMFWPDAPRTVASQGLRSTLYRLRRAISDAAGCEADRYVFVGNSIALDLDWVSVDARAFRNHIELAVVEDAIGNRGAARDHYLQAERLHCGKLLASEAVEPQLQPSAAEFEDLFNSVRSHLVAIFARDETAAL
jgi:hypothetical protein